MGAFAEYTRSSAFRLELSSNMIAALFVVQKLSGKSNPTQWEAGVLENVSNIAGDVPRTLRSLERRGLIIKTDRTYQGTQLPLCSWKLTREGTAVIGLLKLAGFDERPTC